MSDIKVSVTLSLDGSDVELYSFFPYLLQDIWELGSSSKVIIDLLKRNRVKEKLGRLNILDLGCGKGAISIPVIKELNGSVLGIDAIPEFVDDAIKKAEEFGVNNYCEFIISDIREKIKNLSGFNLIMLSSIGPVLGNAGETLKKLDHCLVDNGYIFLDDGYIPEESGLNIENVQGEKEFFEQIEKCNYKIVDQYCFNKKDMEESNKTIYAAIEFRTSELISKYPRKKPLFEKYLEEQAEENYILENKITCVSLLLTKKPRFNYELDM